MKIQSITLKLGITFGLVIAMFLALGVMEVTRLGYIDADSRRAFERRWNKIQLVHEALGYCNANNRIVTQIFLRDSTEQIEPLLAQQAENTKNISARWKTLESQVDSPREKVLLDAVEDARSLYASSYMTSLDMLLHKKENAAARIALLSDTFPLLLVYHGRWNEIADFERLAIDQATEQSRRDNRAELRRVSLLVCLTGLLAGLAALRATRSELQLRVTRDREQQQVTGLNTRLEDDAAVRIADLARANAQLMKHIAEKESSEAEISSAHAEAEQLLSSISSILIGVDARGRVTRWNDVATKTFGISSAHALGRNFDSLGILWHQPGLGQRMASLAKLGGSHRMDDLAFRDTAGEERVLGVTVNPICVELGQHRGFVLLGVDVSQRKLLQEQLRQAQKLEAIGQLAAGIAHEINTPTQYVSDNIAFLQDSWRKLDPLFGLVGRLSQPYGADVLSPDPCAGLLSPRGETEIKYLIEEVPKALLQSQDGIGRISQIIKAMRDFSHPGTVDKQPADLNRAIEASITVSRNEWRYVADVKTDLDPALPLVDCVVGQFQQVVLNLLINAAHAIEEGAGQNSQPKGTIYITSRMVPNAVEIRIEDTGRGIPENIRSRVFEPFFTTKPVGKGTGQGLALVHSIIVIGHSGKIWIESPPGKGAALVIQLPVGNTGETEKVE